MIQINIDESTLRDKGWVEAGKFKDFGVSINMVALMYDKGNKTVEDYIGRGYIPLNEEGKITLSEALMLDFEKMHDDYIRNRPPVKRAKKKRPKQNE